MRSVASSASKQAGRLRSQGPKLLLTLLLVLPASAADLVPPDGSCWKMFAPRSANAPSGERQKTPGSLYSLILASGGKQYVYGGWRCRIEGLEPSAYYLFRARATPRSISNPREALGVQLRWRGDYGEAVAPTYVWESRALREPAGALEFERLVQAPPKTRAVEIELVLQWSASGQVNWEAVSFERATPPKSRKVRVASVWLRPRNSKNGADSVERFAEYIDRIGPEHRPDVILLGEMINRVGVRGEPEEQAEPIPGAATERLSAQARRYHTYIAFSMVERDGPNVFNTGVLLDRQGRIAGKYRKVQLPFEEVSRGIAPGSGFPVFSTDFGKVGMLICHDASFPEAARELALGGAELILMPIWGGRQELVHARAIENSVYLATSGYDYPSEIIDPLGRVLSIAAKDQGPAAAVAEIDLSLRFRQDWIGDWNDTYLRQQRPSAYREGQPRQK